MGDHAEPPIASITHHDTIDDMIEVVMLSSDYANPRVGKLLRNIVWVTLPAVYFGYQWWSRGYDDVVSVLLIFYAAYVFMSVYACVRFKVNLRRALDSTYAKNKHVGKVPPITIDLYPTYIQTESALEMERASWHVIERVEHKGGYLLLVKGNATIYVPDRAFESPEDCGAFRQSALRLYDESRETQADFLTDPPWG